MELHRLKRASDYSVKDWLEKELKLTPYQKELLRDKEIVRFAPFQFYERRQKEKVSALWRITIIPFSVCYALLLIGLPFSFLFTGKWGYGDKILNFHSGWINKLKL